MTDIYNVYHNEDGSITIQYTVTGDDPDRNGWAFTEYKHDIVYTEWFKE